jgi:hypothetical protein
VTGHHNGFTVPEGDTIEVIGDVTTDANVVVEGTLRMRAGSSLTFVDVDEDAFTGPGNVHEPVEADTGLWVFGSGQLDVEGTPKQSWNRTGSHESWSSEDDYIAAPNLPEDEDGTYDAVPWSLGDEVPCVEFAGDEYCTEIANLTRDVTIQGTEEGRAHIYVMSDQPQTIRYAELKHLGPNGEADEADGRYALHLHMMYDDSRGTIVEGVVASHIGDHTFVAHDSHGVTFRDTVAYDVVNTPYWWDHGELTNDTLYDHALAVQVNRGRNSGQSLTGFRMGSGVGNEVRDSAAAGVRGGRPSSGFGWLDGRPNKWTFVDNVAHNNTSGVYHWRNETHADPREAHEQSGFVAYNNGWRGIEQGAYTVQSFWEDTVSFDNGREAIINRAHPRHGELEPGIAYRGGKLGGGDGYAPISVANNRFCRGPVLWKDLDLYPTDTPAIRINASCQDGNDNLEHTFEDVTVEGEPLTEDDFRLDGLPEDGTITVISDGEVVFVFEG